MDSALLTPLGRTLLDTLPLAYREHPFVMGVLHAYARAIEEAEEKLDDLVLAQLWPQTATVLLNMHEMLYGLPPDPAGRTLTQRRGDIQAHTDVMMDPSGAAWERFLARVVGGSFDYREHQYQDDLDSPQPGVIRITLPFPSDSDAYARIEARLRTFVPSWIDIILTSEEGFILGISRLGEQSL